MYAFTPDGATLLFVDCFSLTRVILPGKVKNDRKVTGSSGAHVSVSSDGAQALSWQDAFNRVILWELPALKASRRLDRFAHSKAWLHWKGGALVKHGVDALEIVDLATDASESFSLAGGELLATVCGDGHALDVVNRLTTAADGSWMAMSAYHKEIVAGTFDGGVAWRRPIEGGGRLRLYPHRERPTAVLQTMQGALIIDHDGIETVESVVDPVAAGRWLAYQTDPRTVVRRDRETGQETRHDLELRSQKRMITEENAGPGAILLGATPAEGRLCYLPWHRETVLDLLAGIEIPRKLPSAERPLRSDVLATVRPFVEVAREIGVSVELMSVEPHAKRRSVSLWTSLGGGGSLSSALIARAVNGIWDRLSPGGWSLSSYGGQGDVAYLQVVDVDALVNALADLERTGAPLSTTLYFWDDLYERRLSDRPRYADEPTLPCEPAAEGLLARALLRALEGAPIKAADLVAAGAPTIDEALAAVADYPRRGEVMGYAITKVLCQVLNHLYGAQAAALWISTFFEQEWPGCGTLYYDFETYGVLRLARQHPEAHKVFETWFQEHELQDGPKRYYLERVRDQLAVPAS